MTHITGGCYCGAVRFVATQPPVLVRQCWCRDCQYLGAGSSTVNAAFRAETIAFTGEMRDYVSTADSGSEMHRRFCPACGTPVTTSAASRPQFVGVRLGTLDDPSSVPAPSANIWTASAPAWADLGDLPCTAGQPPPA